MNASGQASSGRVPISCWVERGLWPALLVAGVLSCGARAEPPARAPAQDAPQAVPPPAPGAPAVLNLDELDALEHDLAISEARLDEQLARKRAVAEASPDADEPADQQPASKPKTQPSTEAPRAQSAETAAESEVPPAPTGRVGAPCDLGCRALLSMRRAQERICAITGPVPRCQMATERVASATQRVERAGCSCSSDVPGKSP